MLMVRICAMRVLRKNATHELTDAHMNELRHLLNHYFSVNLILCLVELKLSFLLLSVQHDSSRVSEALLHSIF